MLVENHWYKVVAVVCVVRFVENPGTRLRGRGSALLLVENQCYKFERLWFYVIMQDEKSLVQG